MPTIVGFIIGMLSELVPIGFDEIFGTNLSEIITDESVAEVVLAPFVWMVKLLQMIIVK
jgi:hypothetical protein